jgi:hypothetical protein
MVKVKKRAKARVGGERIPGRSYLALLAESRASIFGSERNEENHSSSHILTLLYCYNWVT